MAETAAAPKEDQAPVQPIETERPRSVELQKAEISMLARATLRREAQRQLGSGDTARPPQTEPQKALRVYQILSDKKEGGFSFGEEGNAVVLPEINGKDLSTGDHVHFETNQASLREIVKTNEDGSFVCTFRDEYGRRVTTTVRDEKTGEDRIDDVKITLPREAVLDAQFLSERQLYEQAVGDQSKLLEAHAAILPQTTEEFIPTDDTSSMVEKAAASAHVLTAKEVLESSFIRQLPPEKRTPLQRRLQDAGVLLPEDVRAVTEAIGWDRQGLYDRHDQIMDELKTIAKQPASEVNKQRAEALREEQARLGEVLKVLTPDAYGKTEVDKLIEQLQKGELTDALAAGMKEAILSGDTTALFNAIEVPEQKIDEKTREKILKAAKIAGVTGMAFAGLAALLAGGVMMMVAQGVGSDQRR